MLLGYFQADQSLACSAGTQQTHVDHTIPGQLSLLPSAGREMSTSQSAVMLCAWGVYPLADKRVGGR